MPNTEEGERERERFLCRTSQRSLEAKKNEVMGLFAQCTQDDVTLNNYLTRSKILKCHLELMAIAVHCLFYTCMIELPELLLRNIKKPTESVAAKKSLKRNPPSGEVAKAKKAKK